MRLTVEEGILILRQRNAYRIQDLFEDGNQPGEMSNQMRERPFDRWVQAVVNEALWVNVNA
jgi:hypothetical protein